MSSPQTLPSGLRLALAAVVLLASAATVALLGWTFHLPAVLSSLGDSGRTAPDTSTLFLVLSGIFFFTLTRRAQKWRLIAAACLTAVALAILVLNALGLLDLTERAVLGTLGFFVPGAVPTMSLVTSLAFVLSGAALFALGMDDEAPLSKTRLTVTVTCATIVATLGSLCLVIFALRFPVGNSWLAGRWMTRMALETSILFTICGSVLIWEARRRARASSAQIFSYIGVVTCIWLLLLFIGVNTTLEVALGNNLRIRNTLRETQQSQAAIQSLATSLRQAESAQYAYLLTVDAAYLRSFDTGQADAKNSLALRLPVGDQWPEVEALRNVARKKLDELNKTVTLQQSGHVQDARLNLQTGRGRELMERVEELQKLIDQRMEEQTSDRNAVYWRSADLVRRTVITSYALALALLVCAIVMFRAEIRRRVAIEHDLRLGEAGLEAQIAERTSELRASETKFRLLTNAIPQVVWRSNTAGSVDFFNERWYELTGAPRDVYGDEAWIPYVHPEDLAVSSEIHHSALRQGRAFENELRLWDRRRQEFRWYLIRSLPVRDDRGEIYAWLGTSTDIHDHKKTELPLSEVGTVENSRP